MTDSEKTKTIGNKIEQKKLILDLDQETAKISALSSGNVDEYESSTGADDLQEKRLLEKTAIYKD